MCDESHLKMVAIADVLCSFFTEEKKVICACWAVIRQLEERFLMWAEADKRPPPTHIKPRQFRPVVMNWMPNPQLRACRSGRPTPLEFITVAFLSVELIWTLLIEKEELAYSLWLFCFWNRRCVWVDVPYRRMIQASPLVVDVWWLGSSIKLTGSFCWQDVSKCAVVTMAVWRYCQNTEKWVYHKKKKRLACFME